MEEILADMGVELRPPSPSGGNAGGKAPGCAIAITGLLGPNATLNCRTPGTPLVAVCRAL